MLTEMKETQPAFPFPLLLTTISKIHHHWLLAQSCTIPLLQLNLSAGEKDSKDLLGTASEHKGRRRCYLALRSAGRGASWIIIVSWTEFNLAPRTISCFWATARQCSLLVRVRHMAPSQQGPQAERFVRQLEWASVEELWCVNRWAGMNILCQRLLSRGYF